MSLRDEFHAVVVTGEYGAGKTTAAMYLLENYAFERLSFVEKIWLPTLERRNIEPTRPALRALGIELVDSIGLPGLIDQLLATRQTSRVVIDDARRVDVLEILRDRIPNVEHIHLVVSFDVRLPRLVARDGADSREWHEQVEADQVTSKRAVLDVAPIADDTIDNEGDQIALHRGLDSVLHERGLV